MQTHIKDKNISCYVMSKYTIECIDTFDAMKYGHSTMTKLIKYDQVDQIWTELIKYDQIEQIWHSLNDQII